MLSVVSYGVETAVRRRGRGRWHVNGGSMAEGTALADRIAERRAGVDDPRAMLGELRGALVLVPFDGGGLWTAEFGGIRWVCGFTDEEALVRFALARSTESDAGAGGRSWEFAELR